MVGRVTCVIHLVGGNMTVLRRQQQVRAWTIDHVEQFTLIPHDWSALHAYAISGIRESAHLAGKRIVLPSRGIELNLGGRSELQLRPSSNCIQTPYLGTRRGGIPGKDGALIKTATKASERLA